MAFALSSKINTGALKRTAACRPRKAARTAVPVKAMLGQGGDKGGNPFGNMGNFMENMKKAQALVQTEAGKIQEELAETEFDGYDEEETVKVVFLGNQQPKSCELTQAAMELSAEDLQSRIEEAMKDAHAKSVAGMREKMSELAQKLGLPPGMQMPGQ